MKPIICSAWSFRGATEGGEPGIHSSRPVVMDSGLAASDLGFTRDRHYSMRTSATADVRWRPGMTWGMFEFRRQSLPASRGGGHGDYSVLFWICRVNAGMSAGLLRCIKGKHAV